MTVAMRVSRFQAFRMARFGLVVALDLKLVDAFP